MKISRCPAIDPDCHAQEAIQGENKSVSFVPNSLNSLGYLSFPLLAWGLLHEMLLFVIRERFYACFAVSSSFPVRSDMANKKNIPVAPCLGCC